MTGDRVAHPLLISMANISMDYRMKTSYHVFSLLALLPVPKFTPKDKKIRGVLENRLIHECLDIVLQPLKSAASVGVMMSDPVGNLRYCFTPLAGYIVDTPEAALLAGVGGKTSPLTMAMYKQFGDPFQHEPRTASVTLAQLHVVESKVHPDHDILAYLKEAKVFRLNGVHRPFWQDWPLAEPTVFLTPEPLHHWFKMFWDHDAKWCARAVGEAEIDFRFSILQPRVGFRHFKEGYSKLKQVTGREHREIQRYIIGIIAGAVPKDFVIAIRALVDFRYLAQMPAIDDDVCDIISAALKEFQDHKNAILDAGVRVGKGKVPIENFHIPKLEFMQSVVTSIRNSGSPIQWSADITEHLHVSELKDPARSGNNQEYDEQICRSLDRIDKYRRFDLATAICSAAATFGLAYQDPDEWDEGDEDNDEGVNHTSQIHPLTTASSLLNNICTVANVAGPTRILSNYFDAAQTLTCGDNRQVLRPLRTFSVGPTAFHLTRDATFKRMNVNDVATMFGLSDLRPALAYFIRRLTLSKNKESTFAIGGRRPMLDPMHLPFGQLEVWSRMRIQPKSVLNPGSIVAAQTLCASPPSKEWPLDRYGCALVDTDPSMHWPASGLQGNTHGYFKARRCRSHNFSHLGHSIAQIRLILRVVPDPTFETIPGLDTFLVYAQRFDFVSQTTTSRPSGTPNGPRRDPATQMYVLKRSTRADGSRLGDIIPLSQLRLPLEIMAHILFNYYC